MADTLVELFKEQRTLTQEEVDDLARIHDRDDLTPAERTAGTWEA
jgi:hypothetical protein